MKSLNLPPFDIADAMAIKAVAEGRAEPYQQQRAIAWILRGVCGIGRLPFEPESERATSFLLGRQSVGFEMQLYITKPADELKQVIEQRSTRRA